MKKANSKLHHPLESLGLVKATRGDIRIEKLELRLAPKVPFPHKHDFYQIVFVCEGSGWHQLDFEKHNVEKMNLFVVKPGQVHSWSLHSKSAGYIVEFTIESFPEDHNGSNEFVASLRSLPDLIRVKGKSEISDFLSLFSLMLKESEQVRFSSKVALQSYLRVLLIEIMRFSPKVPRLHKESGSIVENFRRLVDIHFPQHHSVEFYSRSMGLSSKALTMRISRAVGLSARHLIQERILLEAKRLLVYSSETVSEVGYEVGFEDPNYFVRFFREHTGFTPLRFRQKERHL